MISLKFYNIIFYSTTACEFWFKIDVNPANYLAWIKTINHSYFFFIFTCIYLNTILCCSLLLLRRCKALLANRIQHTFLTHYWVNTSILIYTRLLYSYLMLPVLKYDGVVIANNIEFARTMAKQALGLMFRQSIPPIIQWYLSWKNHPGSMFTCSLYFSRSM